MGSSFLKKIKSNESTEGIVTIRNFLLESDRAIEIDNFLRSAVNIPKKVFDDLIHELESICKVREFSFKNRVVIGARTMQAGRIIGDTTYTGTVNYGALGTGSTAVSDSDSVLDTEVARKPFATRSQTDDSCSIDFYFSKSDTNGTYQEWGTFVDGTSTVDSGVMFNRALTGGWTKTSLEAMTVSQQFNINAVV